MRTFSSPGTRRRPPAAVPALLLAAVASLLSLLSLFPLSATTLVRLSDAELVGAADLVVTGECLDAASRWIDGELYTVATVRIDEALQGAPAATVEVVVPGGADPSAPVPVAVTVPGAPHLAPGERAVLFLTAIDAEAFDSEAFSVVGFSQGKLSIVEGSDGPAVVRDLRGVTFADEDGLSRGSRETGEPLEAFEARIRALVDAQEVQR